MRRRAFLSTSAAAGLALSMPAAQTGKLKPGGIPQRVFGKTGEKLTIIGQAGGRFPMCSFEDAKAITLRAYELGVNYFDTSNVYDSSQENYGKAFRELHLIPGQSGYNERLRSSMFLTSKTALRFGKGGKQKE